MAANDGLIEGLAPGVLVELQAYNKEIVTAMGNIPKLNDFLKNTKTPAGFTAADKSLTDAIKAQDKAIADLQKKLISASDTATQSAAKTLKALESETKARQALDKQRQKAFQDEATRQAKEDAAIIKQLALEDRAAQKKIEASKKVEAQKAKEFAQFERDFAKYEAALEKEGNAYNQIQSKVNALVPTYQNLAAKRELGITLSKSEVKELGIVQGKLLQYQGALIKIDEGMGRHQRKVGDYIGANRNLTASVGQISRELPNFGQSFSVGILSLTNNIGAIIDSIKQVRQENTLLAAEGKKTTGALQQVFTALMGWQTALFIGIGILSAYSKEVADWASEIWNSTKALSANAEAQKRATEAREAFNNTTSKYLQSAIKEEDQTKRIRGVIQDLTKTQKERLDAAENFRNKFPAYLAVFTKEQIVLAESGKFVKGYKDAINELSFAQSRRADAAAKAEQAEKTLAEASDIAQEIRQRELLNEELNKTGANIEEVKKKIEARADKVNDDDAYVEKFGKAQLDALGRFSDQGINRLRIIYQSLRAQFENERKLVNDAYIATSKLDASQTKKAAGKKNKEFDANAAELDARTRYLKELSDLTNKETENEKQARERRIELLQREAKDESKSYDYRINAYGEFLKLKQDATLKDVAQSIAALEQARIAEQEQSKKSENSDLKRAGAFDPIAAIKNATQIAAIRKYYADEEIVRTQKYSEMELEIERKASNAYLDIVEETAKAEILIEKKRQDIIESTREAERSYQIEIFKKAADNEKSSLEIRQSNYQAYIRTRISQMEAAKIKELDAAAGNDELTANIIKNFDIQKTKLLGEKSPYEIAAEQAKAAVKSIADSIKSGFLSDAGLGSLTQFFDGSFNKIIEGLDKITDDGERASEKFHAYFQAISESAQEAFNLIMEMSKKTMQQEYDRLEATKNIDIQFAGESDVAKKEIERQYEARKRALQIREAKRAQDLAIINVNINAAQAIIAGYKDGNYITGTILGVLVTGLAIAQIAAIKSQKLPEYYKGTDNAPAGLAWTQERGAEIITDRHGRVKSLGSDKGAQLTKLDAGDKVFTADKSKDLMNDIYLNRILSERGINQSPAVVNVAAQPAFTQAHVNQIVSAISAIPIAENYIEDGDFKYAIKKGAQRQEIMNSRATQKGFSTRG